MPNQDKKTSNINIKPDQKVLYEASIRVIQPTKEQIEQMIKHADEIGMPDTWEDVDE